MGRPSKLTDELIEKLERLIAAGCYAEVAARVCGISTSTYYRWLDEGRKELAPRKPEEKANGEKAMCVRLVEAIDRADAQAEVTAVIRLYQQRERNWQANFRYLERRHPERWRSRPAEPTSERGLADLFRELWERAGAYVRGDAPHAPDGSEDAAR